MCLSLCCCCIITTSGQGQQTASTKVRTCIPTYILICIDSTFGRVSINHRVRLSILFVRVASWFRTGNIFYPFPRSRQRRWSRETGLAIPSRVSLLILPTQAESGAYSRDSSRFPPRRPNIDIVNRHRDSPEFIRSRNSVPVAFTAESPRAGSSVVLKVVQ